MPSTLRRPFTLVIALALALLLGMAGACAADADDQSSSARDTDTSRSQAEDAELPSDAADGDVRPPLPSAERIVGVTDLADGRVRVVGLLQYRASEGGIWVIVEGVPGEEPLPDAPVIAVIENMYDLDSACSTSGALVYAEGVLGASDEGLPGLALTAEFVALADEP